MILFINLNIIFKNKPYIKRGILMTIFTILYLVSQSQVKPTVINTTGKYVQYAGGYLAYSVGEAFIGPLNGVANKVNLGLLQGYSPMVRGFALRLYLEGLYIGNGVMRPVQGLTGAVYGNGISDKITIELRKAFAPYALAYTFNDVLLNINGNVTFNNLADSITGMYYVVVKTRNCMETWSNEPINIHGAGPIVCNFTSAATQAYGNNLKLMDGGFYAIYGGDANEDGLIDGGDMAVIDNSSVAMLMGYYPEDITGDGIVDGSDMAIIDNNAVFIIFTQRP